MDEDKNGSGFNVNYSNGEIADGECFRDVYAMLRNVARKHPGKTASVDITTDLRALDGQIAQVHIQISIIPAVTGCVEDISATP